MRLSRALTLANKIPRFWAGLLLPVLVGLFCWQTRFGIGLDNLSYDLLFLFKPWETPREMVIVYMDDESDRAFGQAVKVRWDRSIHARLLERLTADQAKLVVFDVLFDLPGTLDEDAALKEAIRKNGRVVLGGFFSENAEKESGAGLEPNPGDDEVQRGARPTKKPVPPLETFRSVAADWGVAELDGEFNPGQIFRRVYQNSESAVSLPWAAAVAAGRQPRYSGDWWLNFCGPRGKIKGVSYSDATNYSLCFPGYFGHKVVFVGKQPSLSGASDARERIPTPFSRWGGKRFTGVEVLATGYLNLARGEALTRPSRMMELLIFIMCGLALGWSFNKIGLRWAVVAAALSFIVVFAVALTLHWEFYMWFSWMTVAGAQIPCALIWKLGVSLAGIQPMPELSSFLTHDGKRRIPNIPDHDLVKRVGMGAYGEVWLARNTIGMFRAVKFVFRDRYSSPHPYQREFRGMEKYMPISLNHPGLVHLLHIGKNDSGGYFFYIMEAGDDELSGQQINPAAYSPRNLSKELKKKGRFSLEECVTLGLYLTTALDHLHGNGLIHRDIKPANIIFVNDIPKLADIGLVTEIASEGKVLTYVGTDGYIPPEGPGTAAGDVYSLGKVLYEVSMGRNRLQYPDLPTSVIEGRDPRLVNLNEIILKACESDPKLRYQSADEIRKDLLLLQQRLNTKGGE
jgi:CHASE2 domain-containing sensor protein